MKADENFKKVLRRQPVTADIDAALSRLVVIDDIIYEEAKALYAERLSKAREHGEQTRTGASQPAASRHGQKRRAQR